MKLKLHLMAETTLARLYADSSQRQQWVPKSVCDNTLKWPSENGAPPVHDVAIADWWLRGNPFERLQPTERELL